jgi:hypothetical protein
MNQFNYLEFPPLTSGCQTLSQVTECYLRLSCLPEDILVFLTQREFSAEIARPTAKQRKPN